MFASMMFYTLCFIFTYFRYYDDEIIKRVHH